MTGFGQKQAKWGEPKQLWHPNEQTFFNKVMIFGLVGDEVKWLQTENSLTPYSGVCRVLVNTIITEKLCK